MHPQGGCGKLFRVSKEHAPDLSPSVTLLLTGVTTLLGYLLNILDALLIINLCLALAHCMHQGNLVGMARSDCAVKSLWSPDDPEVFDHAS